MARADIGLIACPICGMSGAHVRETDKGRAYILCEECNVQIFARGAESDKSIRAAMVPMVPTSHNITAAAVEPVAVIEPEQAESEPEETTIFDYILPKKRIKA